MKEEITILRETVEGLKTDMTILNTKYEMISHVTKILQQQLENLQQYSRRYSVILDHVPVKQKEKTMDVENEVKKLKTLGEVLVTSPLNFKLYSRWLIEFRLS